MKIAKEQKALKAEAAKKRRAADQRLRRHVERKCNDLRKIIHGDLDQKLHELREEVVADLDAKVTHVRQDLETKVTSECYEITSVTSEVAGL